MFSLLEIASLRHWLFPVPEERVKRRKHTYLGIHFIENRNEIKIRAYRDLYSIKKKPWLYFLFVKGLLQYFISPEACVWSLCCSVHPAHQGQACLQACPCLEMCLVFLAIARWSAEGLLVLDQYPAAPVLLLDPLPTNIYLCLGRRHPLWPDLLDSCFLLPLPGTIAWQIPTAPRPWGAVSLEAFRLPPASGCLPLSQASAVLHAFSSLHLVLCRFYACWGPVCHQTVICESRATTYLCTCLF